MIDDQIVALINAGRFAVWRLDIATAERLFAKARRLMEEIHGCR